MSKVWFIVQWGRPHTQKRWPYSRTLWVYLCPHPQTDMLMSSSQYLKTWPFAFRTQIPTRKWQKAGGCVTVQQPKPSWHWSQLLVSLWETQILAVYPVLNRHVLWTTKVITWPRFPTYTNHCINPFFHFVDTKKKKRILFPEMSSLFWTLFHAGRFTDFGFPHQYLV